MKKEMNTSLMVYRSFHKFISKPSPSIRLSALDKIEYLRKQRKDHLRFLKNSLARDEGWHRMIEKKKGMKDKTSHTSGGTKIPALSYGLTTGDQIRSKKVHRNTGT